MKYLIFPLLLGEGKGEVCYTEKVVYRYRYNRTLIPFSQSNKKHQTDVENLLWFHLRNRQLSGYKFRRQYPIANYILDFYCIEKKLAIELDGSQHMESKSYDEKREGLLQSLGITIIRFWYNDVLQNIKAVLEEITIELENTSKITSSQPSPKRRRNYYFGLSTHNS